MAPTMIATLHARGHALASTEAQRARLAEVHRESFDERLERHGVPVLATCGIQVLQVNVGKVCNQTCAHCHVDAGPDRRESMSAETLDQVIELLRRHPIPAVDITGGAPELNPGFRRLVEAARTLGRHVIDRCNLTILTTAPHADLARFLADHEVEVIASLPSFRSAGTDAQRGEGVFARSMDGLRRLNAFGYGRGGALRLHLVHNPVGAFLPGAQCSLERDYRHELATRHGVTFDHLYTMTNMPISRFLEHLERNGRLQAYMETLTNAFNPAAVAGLMCRTQISVAWDGTLYDCDFNQMLELPVVDEAPATLAALLASGRLERRIRTDRHCFGCTAGAGSSCGGAIAE